MYPIWRFCQAWKPGPFPSARPNREKALVLSVWAEGATGCQHDGVTGTPGRAPFPPARLFFLYLVDLFWHFFERNLTTLFHTLKRGLTWEQGLLDWIFSLSLPGEWHWVHEEELGNKRIWWGEEDRKEPLGNPSHHSRITFSPRGWLCGVST